MDSPTRWARACGGTVPGALVGVALHFWARIRFSLAKMLANTPLASCRKPPRRVIRLCAPLATGTGGGDARSLVVHRVAEPLGQHTLVDEY